MDLDGLASAERDRRWRGSFGRAPSLRLRSCESCLARVREVDGAVQAWAFLEPEHALAQARAADELRMSGQPVGALHGVPIGIKDIIDTADMPTENGSVLHAGRTPSRDASVVSLLRAAGAVIMGKTVTTEFATRTPGKTRNPHDPAHTPGGSSSGSAAAVAASMVPLALGSQTTGSTIRPASYCGVYGLKPTHGLIPRHGMFRLSRTLDHVGLFARSIEDIALLCSKSSRLTTSAIPDSRPRARVPYRAVAAGEPPLAPMFAFVKSSLWDRVDADAREAFAELVAHLGDRVEEVELVTPTDEVLEWQRGHRRRRDRDQPRAGVGQGTRQSSRPRSAHASSTAARFARWTICGPSAAFRVLNASLTEMFEQR